MKLWAVLVLFCVVKCSSQQQERKPNVVIIMADDLGYNDVSFRGSNEIPTHNIDALAFNGVILNRHYTPPLCTPSRSSLMTGRNPFRIGMQHFVIPSDEPWALGKDQKLLPQYFKEAGYATALIGKWHLGFYQKQYTPAKRGFDKFFGYLGPYIDYFDYTLKMLYKNYSRGHDMRRNDKVADDFDPIYATDLFTNEAVKVIEKHNTKRPLFMLINHLAPHAANEDDPMQAPADEIDKFEYIENVKRRTLAAMISRLDLSVGTVVKSLQDNKMLKNTASAVFYSDNGGPTIGLHSTNASNYPLRGQKDSSWEGAIRTNAIVYAPFLANQGRVRDQLIHVSDWLPTLGRLAGFKFDSRAKLDGFDQWNMINYGGISPRSEVLNIDDVRGFGSYISHHMKFVNGSSNEGVFDGWLASKNDNGFIEPTLYAKEVRKSEVSRAISAVQRKTLSIDKILELRKAATISCSNSVTKFPCDLKIAPCLFDIYEDPCEENNLANTQPLIRIALEKRYQERKQLVVPSRRKPSDPACDPVNFNLNWNWWQKDS